MNHVLKVFFLIISSVSLYAGSWAQSQLDEMSLTQKLAQLFMLGVWTEGPNNNVKEIEKLIHKYELGSIIFMSGTVQAQKAAYSQLQKSSHLPLLVGQDNEWGLHLRLKDSLRFPRNLTLGALTNVSLIYELGLEVANQCHGVGVHINFSPVVDVNNNPDNPVINDRSFGEDPKLVSDYGLKMMQGLQDGGIMACAKHFPGHGDTHIDSHYSLPIINKSKEALHHLEWMPFKKLIENQLGSVMTAHLLFPSIESEFPSSLSSLMIEETLKDDLGFTGLVITDSFEMKSISNSYNEGDSDLLALKAGNDLIIRFKHFEKVMHYLVEAVETNKISIERIDQKVLKVLETKEKFNLHVSRNLNPHIELFSNKALELKSRLFKEAITLIQDKRILPLSKKKPIAFVQIGRDVLMKNALEVIYAPYEDQCPKGPPPFYKALSKRCKSDYFFLPKQADPKDLERVCQELSSYETIVVGVYEMNKFSKRNFGLQTSTFQLLDYLRKKDNTLCVSLFGSPYSLKYFGDEDLLLMCYENDPEAQIGAAEILFGERKALGKLPITASSKYPRGFQFTESQEAF